LCLLECWLMAGFLPSVFFAIVTVRQGALALHCISISTLFLLLF